MRETTGDAWELWLKTPGSVLAITTNGYVKTNRRAVMGRGIAKEARDRYDGLDLWLGELLLARGNHVQILIGPKPLVSFPVKHHWRQMADIDLIRQSAYELRDLVDREWPDAQVYLPRPGCGNGGLDWGMVEPILQPILDDRFIAIDRR